MAVIPVTMTNLFHAQQHKNAPAHVEELHRDEKHPQGNGIPGRFYRQAGSVMTYKHLVHPQKCCFPMVAPKPATRRCLAHAKLRFLVVPGQLVGTQSSNTKQWIFNFVGSILPLIPCLSVRDRHRKAFPQGGFMELYASRDLFIICSSSGLWSQGSFCFSWFGVRCWPAMRTIRSFWTPLRSTWPGSSANWWLKSCGFRSP